MRHSRFLASVGLAAALALAAAPIASAQSRQRSGRDGGRASAPREQGRASGPRDSGRAVPRGSVRPSRPPVVVAPNRGYYNRPYRSSLNLGFFYGYPGYYGGYRYGRPYGYAPYSYGYPAYGYPAYGWAAPYGYGYGGYSGRAYGGVRIDLPQRDAEVWVDGYFAGTVDDFDGVLQQANLEAGPHRIEVREPGFETISFDVYVEPGRTITYRATMRPLRP